MHRTGSVTAGFVWVLSAAGNASRWQDLASAELNRPRSGWGVGRNGCEARRYYLEFLKSNSFRSQFLTCGMHTSLRSLAKGWLENYLMFRALGGFGEPPLKATVYTQVLESLLIKLLTGNARGSASKRFALSRASELDVF